MDNQHRKIVGYRELEEDEIALMNLVKLKGSELEKIIEAVKATFQVPERELGDIYDKNYKFIDMAETHFQLGIMTLCRAIAKPDSF